jgi:hypothetical protein
VIGRTTKEFYFRRLANLKFSKIRLNFRGSKTPTTIPKFANLFTELNHTVCKHNAEQNSQLSGPSPALKLSRPEGHGSQREGWSTGTPSHSGRSNRLLMFSYSTMYKPTCFRQGPASKLMIKLVWPLELLSVCLSFLSRLQSCISLWYDYAPTVLLSVGPSLFLKARIVAGKCRSAEWQTMSPIDVRQPSDGSPYFISHIQSCTATILVLWPWEITSEAVNSVTARLRLQFSESGIHELSFMKLRARSPQDTLLLIDCFARLLQLSLRLCTKILCKLNYLLIYLLLCLYNPSISQSLVFISGHIYVSSPKQFNGFRTNVALVCLHWYLFYLIFVRPVSIYSP